MENSNTWMTKNNVSESKYTNYDNIIPFNSLYPLSTLFHFYLGFLILSIWLRSKHPYCGLCLPPFLLRIRLRATVMIDSSLKTLIMWSHLGFTWTSQAEFDQSNTCLNKFVTEARYAYPNSGCVRKPPHFWLPNFLSHFLLSFSYQLKKVLGKPLSWFKYSKKAKKKKSYKKLLFFLAFMIYY